jgi:hypothetical protein
MTQQVSHTSCSSTLHLVIIIQCYLCFQASKKYLYQLCSNHNCRKTPLKFSVIPRNKIWKTILTKFFSHSSEMVPIFIFMLQRILYKNRHILCQLKIILHIVNEMPCLSHDFLLLVNYFPRERLFGSRVQMLP